MEKSTKLFLTLWCIVILIMILGIFETSLFGDNEWKNMSLLRKGETVRFQKDWCGRYDFRERAHLYGKHFPDEKHIPDVKQISGRLNFQNKSIEISTGEVLYVRDNPYFFPSSEIERMAIERKEWFKSNHPICSEIQKFYDDNRYLVLLVFGSIFAIYACFRLLNYLVRQIFYTATKAINDAKKDSGLGN